MRLMEMSKDSLQQENKPGQAQRPVDRCYNEIREMAKDGKSTLKISEIKERCLAKGFDDKLVMATIEEYEEINVFSVNQAKTKITFIV